MEGLQHSQVAVVMVPFPEQSHLNSLLHLAHFITSYGIPVHYAGSATHNRQAKLRLQGWESDCSTNIHFHDFQLPPYSTPPPNPDPSMPFPLHLLPLFEASMHLRQPVCQLLLQLSVEFKRIIVIYDSNMAAVVQDVKLIIPNAESYSYLAISAFSLFLMFWNSMPEKPFPLDSDIVFPSRNLSTKEDIPPEIMNFVADQFKYLGLESGRLYNTSRLIEGRYVELLQRLSAKANIKHFAIGPFNPVEMSRSEKQRHRCLEWLDKQETASVIYISFGSTTSMTDEQISELALGLETSVQKFVWVVRRADRGDIFAKDEVRVPQLPQGFQERVIDRGIVIREWAPQLEILAHPSIGGFMSHCGWNSCIESISMGVPIAAWPMHSDQPANAFLLTEVLKTGTIVRDLEHRSPLVMSSAIENAVQTLMASKEGEEMRKRAAELGDAVRDSVSKGGASCLEMDSFIAHITRF